MAQVLITRALAEAARTAARLSERGITPVIAPLTEVRPTLEPAPVGPFDAVLATSAQAAAAAATVPELRDLPVHVVGERTRAAFSAAGFTSVRPAAPDRDALAARLRADLPAGTRCLAVLGEDRHDDWLDTLEALGRPVTRWTVYRAAATGALPAEVVAALEGGAIAAVLHYSPRQARLFLDSSGPHAAAARHVALSEAVAEPLRAAGLAVTVAEQPDESHLIVALDQALAALPVPPGFGQDGDGRSPGHRMEAGEMAKSRDRRRGVTIEASAVTVEPQEAIQPAAAAEPAVADAPVTADAPAPTPLDAGTDLPPKPETAPQPVPPTRIEVQRTSPAMLAVAALLGGGIAGLAMLMVPRLLPDMFAGDAARVAAVESRLTALEAGQAAAMRGLGETRTALDQLGKRIDSAPAPTPSALPAGLMERLARIEAAEASANRQRGEIGDAARREAEALAQRLAATEQALKAQQGPSPAAQAALRLSIYDRVRASLAAGQPIGAEVAALQKDGVPADALRPLLALSSRVPTRAALADEVRRQRRVLAEDTAATARSWGDRLMAMADSLVQVRRVDGPADQPTPAGLTLALEQALGAGDTAKAASLWNRLPEPARRATASLGGDLAALAAAEQALAALTAAELAAVGRR